MIMITLSIVIAAVAESIPIPVVIVSNTAAGSRPVADAAAEAA
jgi:hypothetical protein